MPKLDMQPCHLSFILHHLHLERWQSSTQAGRTTLNRVKDAHKHLPPVEHYLLTHTKAAQYNGKHPVAVWFIFRPQSAKCSCYFRTLYCVKKEKN